MPTPSEAILSPSDPAISARVRGWWSAADASTYPGGVFPAEAAAVAQLNPKAGSVPMVRINGGSGTYRASSDGQPCIRLAGGAKLSAAAFFDSGGTWSDGFAVLALVRMVSPDVQQTNAIRSGNNSFGISLIRDGVTGYGRVAGIANLYSRFGWMPMIFAPLMGSPPNRRTRVVIDGSALFAQGLGVATPTGLLEFSSGYSGTQNVEVSEAVAIEGSLSYPEGLGLCYWLMESRGFERRSNSMIHVGTSVLEQHGSIQEIENQVFLPLGAEGAMEHVCLAVSGAGLDEFESSTADRVAVADYFALQDRIPVWRVGIGHNDTGFNGPVQAMTEQIAAEARASSLPGRVVLQCVTPGSTYSTEIIAANDAWLAGPAVPAHADAVIRTAAWVLTDEGYPAEVGTKPFSISPHANPTYKGGFLFSDSVHLAGPGNVLVSVVATAPLRDQFRVARAIRAVASSPVAGTVSLARHPTDPSLATLTLRLVPTGEPAPTIADAAVVTLPPESASESATVDAGEYDAYASSMGSTPVLIGVVEVESADVLPPTVLSGALGPDGATLTLTLSEAIGPESDIEGFTASVAGSSRAVASATRTAPAQITLVLSSPAYVGESLSVGYAPGNVQDLAGNALASFSVLSVANASEVEEPPPPLVAGVLAVDSVSSASVSLSAAAATGGVPPYAYQLQGSEDGAGGWFDLGDPLPGREWVDSGLLPATVHHYRVLATDSADPPSSALSAAVSATTADAAAVPTPEEVAAAVWDHINRTLT